MGVRSTEAPPREGADRSTPAGGRALTEAPPRQGGERAR